MFSLGIGGMDAAVVMAGFPFEFDLPSVVRVVLENELPVWVSAKDVILEMLRRLTVKGGLNKAFAFDGPGVATLSVTQRATICNMIQELGATPASSPPTSGPGNGSGHKIARATSGICYPTTAPGTTRWSSTWPSSSR